MSAVNVNNNNKNTSNASNFNNNNAIENLQWCKNNNPKHPDTLRLPLG